MGTALFESGYLLPLSACRWLPSSSRSGRRRKRVLPNNRHISPTCGSNSLKLRLRHVQRILPVGTVLSRQLCVWCWCKAGGVGGHRGATRGCHISPVPTPTKLKLRHLHTNWCPILLHQFGAHWTTFGVVAVLAVVTLRATSGGANPNHLRLG